MRVLDGAYGRKLGDLCRRAPTDAGEKSLRKLVDDGSHPKSSLPLDGVSLPYVYDESCHGPSRRTLAVRRITRRALRKLEPWAELEVEETRKRL